MGLSFWLRDLIILEWDITPQFANGVGYGIVVAIVILCFFVMYPTIKLNRLITKFVSEEQLEKELNLLKSKG